MSSINTKRLLTLLVMILGLLALILPVALGQTADQHFVDLVWEDTRNPAGTTYSVYRATGLCSGTPTFSKIATALTVKAFKDLSVTPGNYCYQSTATYGGVESAPSNTASAAVPTFAPTGFTATPR